ncbi:hypothetical protein GPECTOR_164g147 [Gonium pectorale]|uniref:Uncharacterized protein n=1 Tax=Gonium pectorale TaxID=33097 RepID=A0A150FYM5_GONPE|nr:hypothetical protein GPECTOR_164g147 [Gonium pectorale]|eukprot:KXZ42305.1 hypothetical protein GPECTOR_164g147 [Gonium pectorale]
MEINNSSGAETSALMETDNAARLAVEDSSLPAFGRFGRRWEERIIALETTLKQNRQELAEHRQEREQQLAEQEQLEQRLAEQEQRLAKQARKQEQRLAKQEQKRAEQEQRFARLEARVCNAQAVFEGIGSILRRSLVDEARTALTANLPRKEGESWRDYTERLVEEKGSKWLEEQNLSIGVLALLSDGRETP